MDFYISIYGTRRARLPALTFVLPSAGLAVGWSLCTFFQITAFSGENRTFSSPGETGSFQIQLSLWCSVVRMSSKASRLAVNFYSSEFNFTHWEFHLCLVQTFFISIPKYLRLFSNWCLSILFFWNYLINLLPSVKSQHNSRTLPNIWKDHLK